MPNYDDFYYKILPSVENYLALKYMWGGNNFFFKSSHLSKAFQLPPMVIGKALMNLIPKNIVSIYKRNTVYITWKTNFGVKK